MAVSEIQSDYLIIGAGAMGMSFADTLLTETNATITIVDRRHRPGGHWNDAYPYVRLHQPAFFYGVDSRELSSGIKDEQGLNAGLYELASGQEVLSYFDNVMRERFLPSGRVRFFPMSDVAPDGEITSLLSGNRTTVRARKVVDATHSQTAIPATHPPRYTVAAGVTCIPPNDLPRLAPGRPAYVVVGAGKTGIDACLWLIENGAPPERIHWVMARDSWFLDRSTLQPGDESFARWAQSIADQAQASAEAESMDDLFARLEAFGEIIRLDPAVKPESYHCATVSPAELEALRSIPNVIRLGRVLGIEEDAIVLEKGRVPAIPGALYINCTAEGIPARPAKPIFEGNRITLQWVRQCVTTYCASMIAHIEATYEDEAEKNEICVPIAPPEVPADWARMMLQELLSRENWEARRDIMKWQEQSRLEGFRKRSRALMGVDMAATAHLMRYQEFRQPAVERLRQLVAAG